MSNHSHHRAQPARAHPRRGRRPAPPAVRAGRDRLSRDDQGAVNGEPYAGAQVAAYLGAQSVIQRLNAVVPGRWRQQFQSVPAEFVPAGTQAGVPRLPADRHPPRRGGRPRRRRRLRGPRRDGPGLVRRR